MYPFRLFSFRGCVRMRVTSSYKGDMWVQVPLLTTLILYGRESKEPYLIVLPSGKYKMRILHTMERWRPYSHRVIRPSFMRWIFPAIRNYCGGKNTLFICSLSGEVLNGVTSSLPPLSSNDREEVKR